MKNGRYEEDGAVRWYLNGQIHREDGPAIEEANGTKFWFLNGMLHRENEPAVEHTSGSKWWYLNGERHRKDGPAIEYPDGSKQWFLNSNELSEEEFNQWTAKNELNENLHSNLTPKFTERKLKI